MPSINAVAAIINSVGVAGEQARRSIDLAIQDLEVAVRSLPSLGDGEKVRTMREMYNRAVAECHDVQGHIDLAHDAAQELIAQLHG